MAAVFLSVRFLLLRGAGGLIARDRKSAGAQASHNSTTQPDRGRNRVAPSVGQFLIRRNKNIEAP